MKKKESTKKGFPSRGEMESRWKNQTTMVAAAGLEPASTWCMSQDWIRLQSRRIDTAKIHSLHGCRKSQDPKIPIFLFFLFFLENKSI